MSNGLDFDNLQPHCRLSCRDRRRRVETPLWIEEIQLRDVVIVDELDDEVLALELDCLHERTLACQILFTSALIGLCICLIRTKTARSAREDTYGPEANE
ncbi:hypothetical protein BV210_11640 [Halorientalis sp. IM1011]|nr:hypothetical protein BV210_11640 [Halorientalis sp. IM1011]